MPGSSKTGKDNSSKTGNRRKKKGKRNEPRGSVKKPYVDSIRNGKTGVVHPVYRVNAMEGHPGFNVRPANSHSAQPFNRLLIEAFNAKAPVDARIIMPTLYYGLASVVELNERYCLPGQSTTCFDEGTVVGVCSAIIFPAWSGATVEEGGHDVRDWTGTFALRSVATFVDSRFRGHGIGKILKRHQIALARVLKLPYVEWTTRWDNPAMMGVSFDRGARLTAYLPDCMAETAQSSNPLKDDRILLTVPSSGAHPVSQKVSGSGKVIRMLSANDDLPWFHLNRNLKSCFDQTSPAEVHEALWDATMERLKLVTPNDRIYVTVRYDLHREDGYTNEVGAWVQAMRVLIGCFSQHGIEGIGLKRGGFSKTQSGEKPTLNEKRYCTLVFKKRS